MAKRLGKRYQLSRLHRIPYNLMLGQELVRTLLNNKAINGILISLADEPMAIHLLVRIIVKAYAAGLKCGHS